MSQRTAEQISYMQSVDRCQICNVRFGSRKISPKTKESYIIKRCFDHFHFLQDSSKIRAVICQVRWSLFGPSSVFATLITSFLSVHPFQPGRSFVVAVLFTPSLFCQGCNLSYSTERYDASMIWACHYGSSYDFLLILRSLMQYASNDVITYASQDGGSYTRSLLQGQPRAIFKSENKI